MTDRLTQIWKGFSGVTQARLTSTDIGAHARPPARSMKDENRFAEAAALTSGKADAGAAVQAALTALHTDLQSKAKKTRRRKARRGQALSAGFDAEGGPADRLTSSLDETLFADLKFTEARTRRSCSDYLSYAEHRQSAWKSRRKKFLGLF